MPAPSEEYLQEVAGRRAISPAEGGVSIVANRPRVTAPPSSCVSILRDARGVYVNSRHCVTTWSLTRPSRLILPRGGPGETIRLAVLVTDPAAISTGVTEKHRQVGGGSVQVLRQPRLRLHHGRVQAHLSTLLRDDLYVQ